MVTIRSAPSASAKAVVSEATVSRAIGRMRARAPRASSSALRPKVLEAMMDPEMRASYARLRETGG